MTEYVAFEGPAWLWILACFALLAAGIAFGALGAYALRIRFALDRIDDYEDIAATRVDVEREFGAVRARLALLESPEPLPVRIGPPATERDPLSTELEAEGDTMPSLCWHTYVAVRE